MTGTDELLADLPGDRPVVLFPVRLQTRFAVTDSRRELLVRIFPDDLHVDSHEPELTSEERQWAQAYHERVDAAGSDDAGSEAAGSEADPQAAAAAWAELADRFGAPRAAWIVRTSWDPEVPTGRDSDWTRAPHTRLMPDQWLVVGYSELPALSADGVRREVLFAKLGGPIEDTLVTGWNPGASDQETAAHDEVPVDDALRWMVDFDEAERIGMALRIDLTELAVPTVDSLVAVGVKASVGDASDLLEQHFEALRYTTTLGFVPPGTATNNTEAATAGFTTHDPRHDARFAAEFLREQVSDDSNAARTARALGAGLAAFGHAEGGDADDQVGAGAMNTVLWPATWGYFLDNLMFGDALKPAASTSAQWRDDWSLGREAAYALFRDHVRGRGPLPVLRVGEQPYGLLPTVAFNTWRAWGGNDAADVGVHTALSRVRDAYLRTFAWRDVPRLGGTADPESTLVEVLSQSAVPTSFGLQTAIAYPVLNRLVELYKVWASAPTREAAWARVNDQLTKLGIQAGGAAAGARPILGNTVFFAGTHQVDPARLPTVLAGPDGELSPTDPLAVDANYLLDLRQASLVQLRDQTVAEAPRTLLYYLARHAKLSAYLRAIERRQSDRFTYVEPYLMLLPDTTTTCWDRANQTFPGTALSYRAQYEQWSADGAHQDQELADFDRQLETLAGLPTGTLDLLLRETLALTDDRLDAWVTAFATKRLQSLRESGSTGSYVGGYGWLVDLPVPALGGPAASAEHGGYLHAPSVDQARTAALLRSGYAARASDNDPNPLSIDLSSRRVRLAGEILDGVREGQPLGALLGYRFERTLRDRGLAQYVPDFRRRYPAVAGAQGPDSVPDASTVPAVLDGLALVRAVRAFQAGDGAPPWLPSGVPDSGPLTLAASDTEQLLDAVDDAVLAESVFQAMRGNMSRASATMDAIASGDAPAPELESQRTPRQGRVLAHRTLIPLVPLRSGDLPGAGPRASAAPELNAFCGAVLGDLDRYVVGGVYHVADGAQAEAPRISVSALGLDAVDVVFLAATGPEGGSELSARLVDHLLGGRPPGVGPEATVELRAELGDLPAGTFDLATLVELAGTAYQLVGAGRGLTDADLPVPDVPGTGEDPTATVDVSELATRADTAVAAFDSAVEALVLATEAATSGAGSDADPGLAGQLRSALLAVGTFGVSGAVPLVPADATGAVTVLGEQAASLAAVLRARQDQLTPLNETAGGPDAQEQEAGGPDTEAVERHTERLRIVFGAALPALTAFVPTGSAAIAAAFGAATSTLAAAEQVLAHAAVVRPAVRTFQRLRDYVEVLDPSRRLPLALAGVPVGAVDGAPTLTLLAVDGGLFGSGAPITGLLVDSWDEIVPADTQTTGLAFSVDGPGSEPPNAILIAAPARPGEHWTLMNLLITVHEVLEDLPARASTAGLSGFGQFLPATFLGSNRERHTVSTDFSALLGQGAEQGQ